MAYNAALGYDPDKDYSALLSNTNLSADERAQYDKERKAKINKVYGGVEPTLAGSNMTYSQAYDVATGQKKDTTPAFSSVSQSTTPTVGVSSSASEGLKYYDNTMTDDGSRADYSKLISNGILSGASAGEIQTYLNLRNQMIASDPSLAKYANDSITQAAEKYIAEHQNDSDTLIDNLKGIYSGNNSTYAKALEQSNKITDASVESAINDLTAQKDSTNQSYADLFRQLYRDKMMSQKNINQRLASQGITGGMSESSQLGLETSYADALRQGEQERINTLSELDRAITDTRLTGDTTKAQSALDYAVKSADSYAAILQALLDRSDTLEYNNAALEREQAANEKTAARELALAMLQAGAPVSDEVLAAAGISRADADSILAAVKTSQQSSATPTMSVSNALSAVNSGYIDDSIRAVLKANGYTDDLIDYYYQDAAIAAGTPDGWKFYIQNNGLADENGQISPETWSTLLENGATEDMLRSLGYTPKSTTPVIVVPGGNQQPSSDGNQQPSSNGNVASGSSSPITVPGPQITVHAPQTFTPWARTVKTPSNLLSPAAANILNSIISAQKAEGRTSTELTTQEAAALDTALNKGTITNDELNLILNLLGFKE